MGRYLDQNIFGGDRKQKYDALLVNHTTATNIPGNSVLVPTQNTFVKRDKKHGNITKATINKVITAIGTGTTKGNNIFIGKPIGGNRPAGVYMRHNNNKRLSALFIAQPNATYSPIFPATKEAKAAIQKPLAYTYVDNYRLMFVIIWHVRRNMTNTKTHKELAEEKKQYRKTDAYKKYLEQSREKRKVIQT